MTIQPTRLDRWSIARLAGLGVIAAALLPVGAWAAPAPDVAEALAQVQAAETSAQTPQAETPPAETSTAGAPAETPAAETSAETPTAETSAETSAAETSAETPTAGTPAETPTAEASAETPTAETSAETPTPETPAETPTPETSVETSTAETPAETPTPETSAETPTPETSAETPTPETSAETPTAETSAETPTPETSAETPMPETSAETPTRETSAETPTPETSEETSKAETSAETPTPETSAETPSETSAAETPAEAPAADPPPSAPATGWEPPFGGKDTGSAEAPAVPEEVERLERRDQRPEVVIKTILGLIALLTLAYLGAHPRMRWIEHRLRISQVVTAGFPFVALGVIAALPSVGVLTHTVLDELTPLLRFGLGWIGFVTGHRFETRRFDDLPKGTASAVGFATALPFVTVVAAASLLLLFSSEWSEATFSDPVFLRDALILGTAGAMTARSAARLVNGGGSSLALSRLSRIIQLEQFAGITGLAFIAAYFRPFGPDIGWQLPGTAWLFLTIGLGATIGILAYVLLRRPANGAESVVLLLGTVAFASGLASTLYLSPLVVCFVAGVLLANFPNDAKAKLNDALSMLERPIYLLFLVMVGAILEINDWRGWVLGGVFVVARLVGKWLAVNSIVRYTDFDANADENWVATRGPIGQLSIAIVVSAQLLFPQGSIPIIVTAVLTGAIFTEILVQILARGGSAKGGATKAAGKEAPPPPEPGAAATPAGDEAKPQGKRAAPAARAAAPKEEGAAKLPGPPVPEKGGL